MQHVLRGTITRSAYLALLVNLRAIYEALEIQLDANRDNPALAGVDWNSVRRTPALESDIEHFRDRTSHLTTEQSASRYVLQLRKLGAEAPGALLVHAYLRYLGDMYGGQIMRRTLAKAFPDASANSFSFYDFTSVGDQNAFVNSVRSALDALPDHGFDADALLAEAKLGYALHAELFDELASSQAAGTRD